MSFTDGQPFEITEKHLATKWGGYKASKLLRCAWCGHTFQLGDLARWVYTNSEEDHSIGGNPFICVNCDGSREQILEKLSAMSQAYKAAEKTYWWFRKEV